MCCSDFLYGEQPMFTKHPGCTEHGAGSVHMSTLGGPWSGVAAGTHGPGLHCSPKLKWGREAGEGVVAQI